MKTKLVLVLVFLLVACTGPTSSATQVAPSPVGPTPTLPPLKLTPMSPATGTLISLTQGGSFTSEPFAVTEKAFLRVNWRQASTGKFVLIIQNTDPAKAGTPNGEVTFDSVTSPDAMTVDYPFIPGQYVIKVESDGPWMVWVETIKAGPIPLP